MFSLKDPFSLTFFSYYFKDSIYEEAALRLILQHTREGSIFADIGANIGYFSVMAALRAPSGQVVAFELGSENCSIISENIRLNALGNIELVHCAVSDSTGKVFCVDSPVGNAVLKIIEKPNEKDSDLIEVPAVRLDDFFQERKSPDFIKIDVEGAELKVLKGMRRMAPGVSHVLIEIHPGDLLRFGGSEQAVLNELTAMGFEFKEIQKDAQKTDLFMPIETNHND